MGRAIDKNMMSDLYMLSGIPIEVRGVGKLYHPKLKDIAYVGIEYFGHLVSMLTFNVQDLDLEANFIKEHEVTTFDIISINSQQNTNFRKQIISGLNLFFQESVSYSEEYLFFYLGEIKEERIIHKKNYEDIKKALRKMNNLDKEISPEKRVNPKGKMARRIAAQQAAARKKIEEIKAKQNQGNISSFSDLVSAFCIFNHINITTIWDYTFFQFNNQFQRSQLFEDYSIKIQSLMAGADPKKIDVQHYTKKM